MSMHTLDYTKQWLTGPLAGLTLRYREYPSTEDLKFRIVLLQESDADRWGKVKYYDFSLFASEVKARLKRMRRGCIVEA